MRLVLTEPVVDARIAARVVLAAEQVLAGEGATLRQCAAAAHGSDSAPPSVHRAIGRALDAAQRVLVEMGVPTPPMVLTVIDDGA